MLSLQPSLRVGLQSWRPFHYEYLCKESCVISHFGCYNPFHRWRVVCIRENARNCGIDRGKYRGATGHKGRMGSKLVGVLLGALNTEMVYNEEGERVLH